MKMVTINRKVDMFNVHNLFRQTHNNGDIMCVPYDEMCIPFIKPALKVHNISNIQYINV